jgi:hypothetical protein
MKSAFMTSHAIKTPIPASLIKPSNLLVDNIGMPCKNSNLTLASKKNNYNSKNKNKHSGKTKEKKSTLKFYISMPPEFNNSPIRHLRRRYECPSTQTIVVSIDSLFSMYVFAATAVLGYTPMRAVKLKKCQLWCPLAVQGSASEVTLTPSGVMNTENSFVDLPEIYQDSSISPDKPAYVCFKPKSTEISGSWHISNSVNVALMTLVVQQGTVMDLEIEYIENFQGAPLGYTSTLVGAIVGAIYCRPIGAFTPDGVLTI